MCQSYENVPMDQIDPNPRYQSPAINAERAVPIFEVKCPKMTVSKFLKNHKIGKFPHLSKKWTLKICQEKLMDICDFHKKYQSDWMGSF